tara:strand:+ start:1639 stop:2169 length:531 start_codon:yes stop_codon:yes gene_type:complete
MPTMIFNRSTVITVKNVLSQSDRTYLIDFFEKNKVYREKNYNLLRTWQVHVDNNDLIQKEMVTRIRIAAETAMEMKLLPCRNGNLVDYVIGSKANGHCDSVEESNCSVITMIDLSKDLVGGETYFELIEMGAKHHKVNPEPFGNGDIIMYDESMFHGVKQVLSGRRLVLVTWFKKR